MGTRSVLLKSLAVAASASLVLTACDKDEKKGSADRSDTGESASQGTGYGGQGTGTGGAGADRTATPSELDTAFERFGPPGSDWRFTPGTGIYIFDDDGHGGSGVDSPAMAESEKTKPAKDSMRVKSDT